MQALKCRVAERIKPAKGGLCCEASGDPMGISLATSPKRTPTN